MDQDANQFENMEDNVKLFDIQEVDQSVIMRTINELILHILKIYIILTRSFFKKMEVLSSSPLLF